MQPVATPTDELVAHRVGPVAWLTLNRPDRHNALSAAMLSGLGTMAERWNHDPEVHVVVLEGAGERAFVSGADIGQLDNGIDGRRSTGDQPIMRRIDKPVIAMIHGYCIGAGLALAMEADLRIASPDAVFAIPAGRLGIAYPQDAVDRLVAMVGATHAAHLLLTGERIDARRALAIGLLNEVVARDELRERVAALATTIAANAPLSLAASKRGIQAALSGRERDRALAVEAAQTCWHSADFAEGRAAFAEKRAPRWTGR